MNKIINHIRPSFGFVIGTSLIFAFALFTFVPQAKAESPNILVNNDLTIGSTGQAVAVLQGLLQELGYMSIPVTIPLGYFGSITKGAVARYQSAQSVAPTAGYFGPLTKIAMHQQFSARGWLTMLGW